MRVSFRTFLCWARNAIAATALATLPLAHAATITAADLALYEAGMDIIYSQAYFGTSPIDIRFGSIQTLVGPTSANFDASVDLPEYRAVSDLAPDGEPGSVNLFFMESLLYFGSAGFVAGMAPWPADMFVDTASVTSSSWPYSSGFGALLIGHELGHLLGLGHTIEYLRLMSGDGYLTNRLSAAEVTTILSSPLVQDDGGQRFILINPIVMVAAVPEPGTIALTTFALVALAAISRRREARLPATRGPRTRRAT